MLKISKDITAAMNNDPAARNRFEVFLTYQGVHALHNHRVAGFFYKIHLKLLARMIAGWGRFTTGIEIHPAAKIAPGVFIDHGAGVVIGETAVVEEGVVIYQGVTLGGKGDHAAKGQKRHPTIKKSAVIYAGAKVLGDITVGEYSVIGAGSVVLKDVPPCATVVGVPGRIIKIRTCDGCANKGKEACCLSGKSLSASSEKTDDIVDSSSDAENQNE